MLQEWFRSETCFEEGLCCGTQTPCLFDPNVDFIITAVFLILTVVIVFVRGDDATLGHPIPTTGLLRGIYRCICSRAPADAAGSLERSASRSTIPHEMTQVRDSSVSMGAA